MAASPGSGADFRVRRRSGIGLAGRSGRKAGWMSAAATGLEPAAELREVELSIRGMTCAPCAARVQRRLSALEHVTAAVNFATGKGSAIRLAAAGFLNPLIAGAAMAASSVFVLASSIRLRRFGPDKDHQPCPNRPDAPSGRKTG